MSESIEANLEVVQPSVIEALERAAIDVQVSTAHAYPRSLAKFKQRSMEMATLDEETAESCIYARPVGKDRDGNQTFAEGASIRLAEIVAASYGNLRVAARIIEQTPRFVRCEGVAHDLESNYAGKSEVIEATVTKEGRPFSERMSAVIAKATLAKAYRDAVFKVVPKALCKSVIDAAKKIASGQGKPLETRRAKVQMWLATLKGGDGKMLNEKRVFTALSVAGWAEVGEDHLMTLTGLKTSIADGEVTVDDAFPGQQEPEKAKVPGTVPPPAPKKKDDGALPLNDDRKSPAAVVREKMKADGVAWEKISKWITDNGGEASDTPEGTADRVLETVIANWSAITF